MDNEPRRPILSLKKKPAPGSAGKPQADAVPRKPADKASLPRKAGSKGGKPAKSQPKRVLPPHRRPAELKAQALVRTLQQQHPALFPGDGVPITQPWAIGIHGQVMQRYGVSQGIARRALAHWSQRRAHEYARCLAQGGPRYGFDGPTGEISSAQQERATQG
jgi:hypothetical protein